MKEIAALVFLSALAAGCSMATYSPLSEDQRCEAGPAGAISGVVTSHGKPVTGAVVQLWYESSDVVLEATTDTSGHFAFTCLGPEWYSITVASPSRIWPRDIHVKLLKSAYIELGI